MSHFRRIAVLGGGAWGTALAITARRAGAETSLWVREQAVAAAIIETGRNPVYLPGVTLDPAIRATHDLGAAIDGADAVLLVVPAQHMRALLVRLGPVLATGVPLVLAAKGIERGTGATMSELAAGLLPAHPLAVLSGPTFAIDVAENRPTAVTIAAASAELAGSLVTALGTPSFRPYQGNDPIGCEIGGAVKNVLAIAAGIVAGRGLGDNARAALITRGLAEMVRLALAKGAREATLMGLSGLGDLVLTCTAVQSRNYSLGLGLGAGRSLAEIECSRQSIAEGVQSAAAIAALAGRLGVDMPIVAAVDAILHHGAAIDDRIRLLLDRPFRAETAVHSETGG